MNPLNDRFSITNLGFLVLLGISNTLFTWARSFEAKEQEYFKKYLNLLGTEAMVSAFLFLFGSIIKFAMHYVDKEWASPYLFTKNIDKFAFYSAYFICFTVALFLLVWMLSRLVVAVVNHLIASKV